MRLLLLFLFVMTSVSIRSQNLTEEIKYFVDSVDIYISNPESKTSIGFSHNNKSLDQSDENYCINIPVSKDKRILILELMENYGILSEFYRYSSESDDDIGNLIGLNSKKSVLQSNATLFFQIDYETPGHSVSLICLLIDKNEAMNFIEELNLITHYQHCMSELEIR